MPQVGLMQPVAEQVQPPNALEASGTGHELFESFFWHALHDQK